ncbi:MAG: DUF1501 domain-containing protein [Kofleriaceae bacterium]
MNRRELLTYAGAAGLLATLPKPMIARAATTGPKRRLIMVYARGGWDPTLVLDPKTQSAQIDVAPGARKNYSGLPVFADPATRPNVDTFFTRHASSAAIVRGISVASVVHLECQKRMATGTREETNADMGAIVAHDHGNDLALPYLILGETAYAGPYAASAGRVGTSNQIIALLDPAQAYQTGGRPILAPTAAEEAALAAYTAAGVERARATRGATGYNKKRIDDFASSIERGKALRPLRSSLGTRGRTLALTDQIDLALEALNGGVSQAAMLSTRVSWDDHDDITDQIPSAEMTYAALTHLMDQLKTRNSSLQAGTKMIDDTVVLCFSEFGRTPKKNANGGKDHWPVTAALVMGAGIDGGRAFGATNDGLEAQAIDFATGATSATGRTLMSSHFVAGVLRACNVEPTSHLAATEVFDAFVA